MNLWNIKDLPVPSVATYKHQDRSIDLLTLRTIISDFIYVLSKRSIQKEAALLSRSIYRMKTKFRNDKGFKCMEKMNRALLQMLRLRFTETLRWYLDIIPKEYEMDTYLPTLNMLHYILVRVQGLSMLFVRLCEVSRNAACFMQERIYIAHMWKVAFIMYSLISRIYVLGKNLVKFCYEFYDKLMPYCSKFKNIGTAWLPNDYILPDNLKIWLDIDWLNLDSAIDAKEQVTLHIPTQDVDSDSDVEFCNEYVEILNGDIVNTNSKVKVSSIEEDIGEAVVPIKASMSKLSKKKPCSVLDINTLDDLKRIARNFEKIKRKNSKAFKNIDKLQCNMLHGLIKKSLKKAKKHRIDNVIVSRCIIDVKKLLKLYLEG